MDKVIRIVQWKLNSKIYNAICYRVWKFCFLGNRQPSYKCQFACWDGSRVPVQVRGFKTTWSGKLSDSYTTAVYIYVLQNWKKELQMLMGHQTRP